MGVDGVNGPAVFLDRDGVLNRAPVREGKPYAPSSLEELEILPGVEASLRRLKAAGFALIVVTNQPDVVRGLQSRETVEAVNHALGAALPIDEFRVCYHDDADDCECRKPRPGLLLQPPRYTVDESIMVGDRWRDIEAGRRAGVRATVLVDYGYSEGITVDPDLRARSLAAAVDWILATHAPRSR
jgi:D-glycero-D-manno-heptose 1,7-bisphosphate phosphatase